VHLIINLVNDHPVIIHVKSVSFIGGVNWDYH